jgi:disulfide bond formation protein DsbB
MLIGIGAAQSTAELVEFQRTGRGMPMHPHGHPDPSTTISMGLYDPAQHWPQDQLAYISGGPRPSTFKRDLQGVSNQIPQWAWLVAGGAFIVLGIMSFRKSSKRKK